MYIFHSTWLSELELKENDEVDFFKMNEKSFILAKKSDITNMIMGGRPQVQVQPKAAAQQLAQNQQSRGPGADARGAHRGTQKDRHAQMTTGLLRTSQSS